MSVGCDGSPARPPRSRCGSGATSSSGSGCRSPSASPARSSSPRWRAAWPSPTGCSWCRPTASSRSSTRSRSRRLWGVGPVTAGKLHDRGITTVGEVARLTEDALVSMLGRASGRHLHALAHNHDPRPVQVGRRRRSIGSQRALGRSPRAPDELDAMVVGARRPRHPPDARRGRVGRTVVLRLRFDDFSRATRSHTLPHATAHTQTILATVRALLRGGDADDRAPGPHARRHRGRQPRRRRRGPARAAVRSRAAAPRSTPRSTTCATGSASTPSPARSCSAATRA